MIFCIENIYMLEKAICFKFDLERMKMKIYIIGGSGKDKEKHQKTFQYLDLKNRITKTNIFRTKNG